MGTGGDIREEGLEAADAVINPSVGKEIGNGFQPSVIPFLQVSFTRIRKSYLDSTIH